ncbi:hypothetical protein R6Q59_019887 [Mikania micrantha]
MPEWKAKSKRNSDIKSKSIGDKHTLGSQTYMTAKRKAAKILGRELQPHEMWKQSHCRKGSRPLDKDLTYSSSLVSNVDLEENIEKENLVWVDDRAKETWDKNDGYLVKNVNDSNTLGRKEPENEKLNEIIKEILKEKEEEEKERLNGIIAELEAEKEKHKVENDAMSNRMLKIEDMLKT